MAGFIIGSKICPQTCARRSTCDWLGSNWSSSSSNCIHNVLKANETVDENVTVELTMIWKLLLNRMNGILAASTDVTRVPYDACLHPASWLCLSYGDPLDVPLLV